VTAVATPVAVLERVGHVGVLTLNRPERRNAVNAALSLAAGEALEEIAADPVIRVAVITGAGQAFCAGADLRELAAGRTVLAPGREDWGFAGIASHFVPKPVIAAVNGFALGGGTEIVLAADLAVAAEDASFGLPEVRRGLMAAAGGAIRMHRQLPHKVGLRLLLTGESISAAEACSYGLVNEVVSSGAALESAMTLAETIAGNAPLAVQATKRVAYGTLAYPDDWDPEAWRWSVREMRALLRSADGKEGPRAFAEKRQPVWTGS
jgi:crotonobetainyl-CoA hydratase